MAMNHFLQTRSTNQLIERRDGLLGGGHCSLVPFQSCPMLPCSRTFSLFVPLSINLPTMFSSFNLESFVPLFPRNRLLFPCSLRYFAAVPLFPKTLRDPQRQNAGSHNSFRIWCVVNESDSFHSKSTSRIAPVIFPRRTNGEREKPLRRPKKRC